MANTQVAISADFLTAFSKLPRQIQGKTTEFINKFRNDPLAPGINYEKLKAITDKKIWSVRIDEAYRGIVVRDDESNVYLLLWVDHHDAAYDWAKRKKCEVNRITGVLQVFDVVAQEDFRSDAASSDGMFSSISEKDLMRIGVPEDVIPFVKGLSSQKSLDDAKEILPKDVYENLSWIAEGIPVEEVAEMIASENEAAVENATSFAKALENPINLSAYVVVEGEEELRAMMDKPLEKWRVFLHPTQRKIVSKHFNGPARVLGGAGTGKTVVAMHRAKMLAASLTGRERLLFTTFTANLAQDIQDNLRKICTAEELKRIEVKNIDAWVGAFLRENDFAGKVIYGDELNKIWNDAMQAASDEPGFDEDFYREEWIRVVEAQEAFTIQDYIRASRTGRGTRLDRGKRIQVWNVFETYINLMKERKVRDIGYAMYECERILERLASERRYRHIIIDEGQDLSPNAYRMFRTLMGEEGRDDIFIVGDAHQRIYENKASLSKSGINIRGRSSYLRINYRTTEEIRKYAFALLNGISFDDMDESEDIGDKCKSLTHGDAPVRMHFKDANAEMDFLTTELNRLIQDNTQAKDVCIVARRNSDVASYLAQLKNAGIRGYEIKRSKIDDRGLDGVRVATMHRVKGLEFKYVFLVAVNDGIVPLSSAIRHSDAVSEYESLASEKCLLYVALTRAKLGAYICSYGKKSGLI